MSDYIYENQPLTIVFSDTDETDMSAYTLRVDYWLPGNDSSTPSGTVADGDITCPYGGNDYQCSFTIAADILTPYSDTKQFRFQMVDDDTDTPWNTQSFYILKRGSI